MTFLSRLFRRAKRQAEPNERDNADQPAPTPSSSEPERADPPELVPAIEALKKGRPDKAVRLAEIHSNHPDQSTAADARRICAMALSRLERWSDAFDAWLALFKIEPSANNAWQLATVSVMCHEVDRGAAWFEKAQEMNESESSINRVTLRTNFITALANAGYPHLALEHLEWMRELYAHLRITDSTFLWMRGVPFFSAFLENSEPIVRAVKPLEDARAWYAPLAEAVDDEGKEAIARMQSAWP